MNNISTILLLCLVSLKVTHTPIKEVVTLKKEKRPISKEISVVATCYYAEVAQCDANPNETADGTIINPDSASSYRIVALSRNLLKRWNGKIGYGDSIEVVSGVPKNLKGKYIVRDCLNKRYKNRIDFLLTKDEPVDRYDDVKIIRI